MKSFAGFTNSNRLSVRIPDEFVTRLVPHIHDLDEIKIALYAIWFVEKSGGQANPIYLEDFFEEEDFSSSFGENPNERTERILAALTKAVEDKILITQQNFLSEPNTAFFVNSPEGRRALQTNDTSTEGLPSKKSIEKNTIFQLYEENFGMLTPMIVEALKDAEENYPSQWIEEAMKIAVENNVHRWRYVEAILKSWQEEGRHGTDTKTAEEDYRRYLKGKYGEYIER